MKSKSILLAGVLAAVVYFIWGMLCWMVLPLHGPTVAGLPQESEFTALLKEQDLKTGVYIAPWSDDPEDMQNAESAYMQAHRSGPLYAIFYQQEGAIPMGSDVLLGGFVIDLLACLLAASLLSCATGGCCQSYPRRVGFVAGLGVFVALIGHASYWNWMHFSTAYTLAFMVDNILGWTFAGLVIAAFVRPDAGTTPNPIPADSGETQS